MQEFDLKAKINCTMGVAVVAENRKEAERLLDDTIDSITFKELKSEFRHTKDEYKTEKFTVLLYKTLNFDNKNLIVGKKIKIKGKIYGNLYRNCKYRRRLIIIPTDIEILKGDDE